MKLSSPQWQEAYRLLDDALDLPAGERSAWLKDLAPDQAHLRPLLAQMLADHDTIEARGFLNNLPAFAALAKKR
jgi:hypothetical protein